MVQRTYVNTWTPTLKVFRRGEVTKISSDFGWVANNSYISYFNKAGGTHLLSDEAYLSFSPSQKDTNRLYAKLVDAIDGKSSDLLTSVLEWNSSLRMITARATQLASAFKALRRFDLPLMAKELAMPPEAIRRAERRGWKDSQTPTSMWLEYWMGWAPAIGDIYNAVDVLQRPPPSPHFSVGVNVQRKESLVIGSPSGSSYSLKTVRVDGSYAAYGDVQITNRNLFIANQLGLVNPALSLYRAIPFSWLVDWAINLDQVISSLNAFAGLSFSRTGTALMYEANVSYAGWSTQNAGTSNAKKIYFSDVASSRFKSRTPQILPTPRLSVQLPRLSLTRAATAVSLLAETFLLGNKK